MRDLVRAMIEEELRSSAMSDERQIEYGVVGDRLARRIIRCARVAAALHGESASGETMRPAADRLLRRESGR